MQNVFRKLGVFLLPFTFLFVSSKSGAVELTKQDPFDPVIAIPSGLHQGRIIKTSQARPLVAIERDQKVYEAFGADIETEWLFANFSHDAGEGLRHWIAAIPKDSVESAYWLKNTFTVQESMQESDAEALAHSQVVFQLSKPVRLLVSQDKVADLRADQLLAMTKRKQLPLLVDAVTASFEALFQFDDEAGDLDFFDKDLWVLRDAIPATTRVLSWATRRAEMVDQKGGEEAYLKSHFEYPIAELDGSYLNRVFDMAVHDSAAAGVDEFYHLFTNSCTTRAFKWVDTAAEGAPSSDEYLQYYGKEENLKKLMTKAMDTFSHQDRVPSLQGNSVLNDIFLELSRRGPEGMAAHLLDDSQRPKLEVLVQPNVLQAIPSLVRENLEIRFGETGNP